MNTLSEHYGLLLGLDRSWRVVDVDLSLEEKRVAIRIEHVPGASVCCPGMLGCATTEGSCSAAVVAASGHDAV